MLIASVIVAIFFLLLWVVQNGDGIREQRIIDNRGISVTCSSGVTTIQNNNTFPIVVVHWSADGKSGGDCTVKPNTYFTTKNKYYRIYLGNGRMRSPVIYVTDSNPFGSAVLPAIDTDGTSRPPCAISEASNPK
jgi:hypothetical protein